MAGQEDQPKKKRLGKDMPSLAKADVSQLGSEELVLEAFATRDKRPPRKQKLHHAPPKDESRKVRGRRPKPPGKKALRTSDSGPLTPLGRMGVMSSLEVHDTMKLALRKAKVVKMAVEQRLTYAEIATKLGVSTYTVAKDLEDSLSELNAMRLQDVNNRRLLEIQRSERADRLLERGLHHNDPRIRNQTADAMRSNAEFRARLDGLYAKQDDSWSANDVVSFVLGFTRDLLAEFTDDEAKRRIHRIYQRRASNALPDIEVPQSRALPEGGRDDGTPPEGTS